MAERGPGRAATTRVRVAGALLALLGVFGVLAGFVLVAGHLYLGAVFEGVIGALGDGVVVAGIAVAVVGAAQVAAAIALRRGHPGARRWAIALAIAGAVLAAARLGPQDPAGPLVTIGLHLVVVMLLAVGSAKARGDRGTDADA